MQAVATIGGNFYWYVSPENTLPETNIAPENRLSQEETSIPTLHFQVLCLFQVGYIKYVFCSNLYNRTCRFFVHPTYSS